MPRVRAESTYIPDSHKNKVRAVVPADVRDALGARCGDRLIFDEGCPAAVERAAGKGKYFVVRLVRAPGSGPLESEPEAREADATEPIPELPPEPSAPAAPQLEPLSEAVRRRLGGFSK